MVKGQWRAWSAVFLGTAIAWSSLLLRAEAALLVGNTRGNDIRLIDERTGRLGPVFIGADQGLVSPDTLLYGPDGNLYISSGTTPENSAIYRFNGLTGEFIDIFAQGGGMHRPYGIAFGPDGNLYVSSFLSDEILRYDGTTGAFIDVFAAGNDTPNGLNGPNGLLFGPDGALYVTTQGSVATNGVPVFKGYESQILRYDLATGQGSVFVAQPPAGALGFVSFLGMAIAPDGSLYVTDFADGIRSYDFVTGALLNEFDAAFPGVTPRQNFVGAIAFDPSGNFYTVGFDFTNNNSGVLKYDGTSPTGMLVTGPTPELNRSIGIAYAPFEVPEPTAIAGLAVLGLGVLGQRRRDSSR